LAESLLLSVIGGLAGVALAGFGIRTLIALSPEGIPRGETGGLGVRVLLFSLVVSVAAGVGFGLVPAPPASRRDLSDALREGERGSTDGAGRNRVRSMLVASEFALALVLLVGAGLMMRTFVALQSIDPGFDPHNVLSMVMSIAGTKEAPIGQR